MINRKDFMKDCAAALCATGLCCGIRSPEAAAENAGQSCDPKELADTQSRADAARLRFSGSFRFLKPNCPSRNGSRYCTRSELNVQIFTALL